MPSILYLPTRYFPAISGAEFYIQRLAEILSSDHNYNTNIITSNAIDFSALRSHKGKIIETNDKYFSEVNRIKVIRYNVDYNKTLVEKIELLKELDEYQELNLSDLCLKRLIRNGPFLDSFFDDLIKSEDVPRYDLIHTTFYPYFNLVLSLMIGKKLNIPTICTPFFHFSNPRYNDSIKLEILEKFDLLIACTNTEKEELMKRLNLPSEKIEVLPMGVDFKIFNRVHKEIYKNFTFKGKFFKKGDRNYNLILYCGYKNFEKGAISILKAIPSILKKHKKIYFALIGPPTMAFNMELSKIRNKTGVKIINLTPDNLSGYFDKIKLTAFKECDIYLMPSRSDAFGIAYLEAWASGKPVIGANIGASPEVIRNNIDGLLVEFDNPEDIAEKVLYLLRNKKIRKKLGKNGKIKVQKKYTWQIVAQKTQKIYQNLLTNQSEN